MIATHNLKDKTPIEKAAPNIDSRFHSLIRSFLNQTERNIKKQDKDKQTDSSKEVE